MARKIKKTRRQTGLSASTKRGLWILVLFGLIALFIFGFLGYFGVVGDWFDQVLAVAFGWVRLGVPVVILGIIYYLIKKELYDIPKSKYWGMALFFLGLAGVFHVFIPVSEMQIAATQGLGGGYLGYIVAFLLNRFLELWGAVFIIFVMIFAGFLIVFDIPLGVIFIGTEEKPSKLAQLWHRWQKEKEAVMAEEDDEEEEDYDEDEEDDEEPPYADPPSLKATEGQGASEGKEGKESVKRLQDEEEEDEEEDIVVKPRRRRKRIQIPLDLLDDRNSQANGGNIEANQEIIENTLENFNIPVEMGEVNIGPTVTQYTLKPAEGVKLSRILALNNDLALALAAHPIRIEAPIPGKALIGIEVPNKTSALIGLKQQIASREFKKARKKGKLLLPLGLDVSGKSYVVALDKLPHLLVAGATGSGKSVFINAMILSMIYQYGPDDVKFIMVDPKRVELPVYNKIPYLITPVITDIKKTINALKWLIVEMDRRYDLLANKSKRNIADYNDVAEEPIPYIVLIIDELADLMIAAAADVETHIIRLAQMARAVGIHLILATQRPSVDVITGLLKANIPGRIAFSVASSIDSRTILDSLGAEKLVGRGDMLFSSAEVSKPKRIQGAYVSEQEVKRVASFLADELGEPEYIEDVVEKQQTPTAFTAVDEDGDELFDEAKETVVKAQKASTSYLQRKLRIGYARAARLMDLLEEAGIVSAQDGSRAREVLLQDDEDVIINEEYPDEGEEEDSEETPDVDDEDDDWEEEEE